MKMLNVTLCWDFWWRDVPASISFGDRCVTQAAAKCHQVALSLSFRVTAFRPPKPRSGLSVMNAVQGYSSTRTISSVWTGSVRVNVMVPGVVLTNVWKPEERESFRQWMESSLPSQYAGNQKILLMRCWWRPTQPEPCISRWWIAIDLNWASTLPNAM